MSEFRDSEKRQGSLISRRRMLEHSVGAVAAGAVGFSAGRAGADVAGESAESSVIVNDRINQSIVHWCFQKHWDIEKTCQVAKQLGCKSVELVPPKHWPTLKKYGLICALAPSHLFVKGMNHPEYQPECLDKLKKSIDACHEHGYPNVITFTGFGFSLSPEEGLKNCVEGYKQIVGYAEKKNVTLCLEMLNSRVKTEMMGHPGYQGDHTDYVMDIIKQVASPRLKLLFDIYHVQVMDGDIIARIREYRDHIGHYHTAGNPGRREIDAKQEINYKPIMKEIARTGYQGYVGQEFIPTGDAFAGLKQAVQLCDV